VESKKVKKQTFSGIKNRDQIARMSKPKIMPGEEGECWGVERQNQEKSCPAEDHHLLEIQKNADYPARDSSKDGKGGPKRG